MNSYNIGIDKKGLLEIDIPKGDAALPLDVNNCKEPITKGKLISLLAIVLGI